MYSKDSGIFLKISYMIPSMLLNHKQKLKQKILNVAQQNYKEETA